MLSLVCVTYRGVARVVHLLESIPSATCGGPAAVWVYNDGVPEQHAPPGDRWRFHAWTGSRNLGVVGAYNQAVGKAVKDSAEWVVLADDDLIFPEGWWSITRKLTQAFPTAGVFSWKSNHNPPEIKGLVEPATRLAGYCYLFRAGVWKDLSGFDERFHHYRGDEDFALRATLAGYPCYRVHWPLVEHEEHAAVRANPELDAEGWRALDNFAWDKKWNCSGGDMEEKALKRWGLLRGACGEK